MKPRNRFKDRVAFEVASGLAKEKLGRKKEAEGHFAAARARIEEAEKHLPEEWKKGFRNVEDYGFLRAEAFRASRSNASR